MRESSIRPSSRISIKSAYAKSSWLAELSGHLIQAVKFGGGLLGHLDKGGQFNVKPEQVSPGFLGTDSPEHPNEGQSSFLQDNCGATEDASQQFPSRIPMI